MENSLFVNGNSPSPDASPNNAFDLQRRKGVLHLISHEFTQEEPTVWKQLHSGRQLDPGCFKAAKTARTFSRPTDALHT